MPIRVLEPEVASRIAAGEVVERPASVVKELVENSLDAGSSQIAIEIRDSGGSLIRVTDNGSGIPPGELESAFERHATSKITALSDLESIVSLGFRGEALPSIAAVAEIDIASCTRGQSAADYLSLKDGIAVERGSRGRSQGTTVTVRNLFRNIPARLKFLKSPATENSHTTNVVSQYALAYPEVKFDLSIDGRTVVTTPGSGRLIDSVTQLYGPEVARNVLGLNRDDSGENKGTFSPLLVTGLVGLPAIARSSRGHLSFFVNRRLISSRLLARAVEEAYHGLLMQGKYPLAIINLSMPLDEVDVNVHPTKTEVKFHNERLVFATVQKTVRQSLTELSPTPRIEEVATYQTTPPPGRPLTIPAGFEHHPVSLPPVAQPPLVSSLPALRPLGQINGTYIVAEGPDGLYLIDQHAAHERVLFEKLKQQQASREVEKQGLLEPFTLEVSPQEDGMLKSHGESLVEFGFSIEPFGDQAYLIRAVPAMLHQQDWTATLREILDSPPSQDRNDWTEKMTTSIACHGAIRAGQTLNDDEMRQLIRQLEAAGIANTCPHGRPTMIHLSSAQLAKEFRRT